MHFMPQKGRSNGLDIFSLPVAIIASLHLWGCGAGLTATDVTKLHVIGFVGQTNDLVCFEGGQTTETNHRPTVAGASVTPGSANVAQWNNKPVVAEVTPMPSYKWTVSADTVICPAMQLRSDMDAQGRIIRGKGLPFSSLHVDRIKGFEGWQVSTDGEHLTVTFTNNTDAPLNNVQMIVFYEGCFGKPMPQAVPITIGTLRPGDLYRERIAIHVTDQRQNNKDARQYVAHTLRLTGFSSTHYVLIEDLVHTRERLNIQCKNGVWR